MSPIFCTIHYKEGIVFGYNESYTFDGEIVQGNKKFVFTYNFSYYIRNNKLF